MTREPRDTETEQGFVIVGVVMFVLALTILGLSLFSISSFESQFMGRSLATEQAFSGAASGMERARFRMVATGTLDAAATVVGTDGVTYARAFQDGDSTGAIDGGGGHVEIRVRAGVSGSQYWMRAEYLPGFGTDFYRRLVTTSGDIEIGDDAVVPRCGSAVFEGSVWQNSASTAWTSCAASPPPPIVIPPPAVPVPPVANYFSAHPGGTSVAVTNVGGNDHYNLQGTPGAVTYYRWTNGSADPNWTVHATTRAFLDVQGRAVWIIPGGMWSFSRVTVTGGPNDALIIVAGKSGASEQQGIEFVSGIESANVPVILVSNGKVIISTNPDHDQDVLTTYLSIYSNGLEATGPKTSGGIKLRMRHASGAAQDQPGGLIQQLIAAGALPSATTTSVPMAMVPTTWRQASN